MFGNNKGDVVLPATTVQPMLKPSALPNASGAIGVGTWLTQAEFKDIQVTHDGQTLYQKDFTQGFADWKTSGGHWSIDNGALEQTSDEEDRRAIAGDPAWTDYTYTLKARKLSGSEGFLVMVRAKDNDNFVWLNVGGWGNTHTQLESSVDGMKNTFGPSAPITVETGRWYDIKIEVTGQHIVCSIDGKQIIDATDVQTLADPLYTEASRDNASGDVILKVVNTTDIDIPTQIVLQGAGRVASRGKNIFLTGNRNDVNTIDNPEKIVPHTETIDGRGSNFTHTFPAHSVNVLRVSTK
jgi:alpha-L-arabinofuranosidase